MINVFHGTSQSHLDGTVGTTVPLELPLGPADPGVPALVPREGVHGHGGGGAGLELHVDHLVVGHVVVAVVDAAAVGARLQGLAQRREVTWWRNNRRFRFQLLSILIVDSASVAITENLALNLFPILEIDNYSGFSHCSCIGDGKNGDTA